MSEVLSSPDDKLCEQCHSYRLKECFYPAGTREHKLFRRKWHTVVENQNKCIFCELVHDSLSLHEKFRSLEAQRKLSYVDLLFRNTGTLEWKPPGQNVIGGKSSNTSRLTDMVANKNQRSVRSLRIDVYGSDREPLLDTRVYPTVGKTSSPWDQLLHFREVSQKCADLSLVSRWIEICDNTHGSKCRSSIWDNMANAGLCMVDVRDRCIVTIDGSIEYLALSYCWGNVNDCLQLIKSNRQALNVKGSLGDERSDLPQTIRDAIRLACDLKQRYLWVDALCICQDDDDGKMKQILQMDKIYQHASLTIVAAGGANSWSGLSRLNTSTQRVRNITRIVCGITLASSYPQQHFDVALAESVWASRAWTFQEHLLSTRLLIFGEDEMAWECGCSRFAESLHLECVDTDISVKLRSSIDYSTKQMGNVSAFQRYNLLVERISRRRLGNEADRLHCMQGLINTMEMYFPGGFLWGLPRATFDSGLLFQAGPFDEAPLERNEGFPSWCWAGWREETDSQITSPYDRYPINAAVEPLGFWSDNKTREPSWLRKEVAWVHIDTNGRDWVPIQSTFIGQQGSLYYDESIARWERTPQEEVLEKTKTRFAEADVPLSHALVGWTQVTHLEVDRTRADVEDENWIGMDNLNNGHGNGFAIRAPSGQVIGYISLDEEYRRYEPDRLRFILLSQHRRFEGHLGLLFDILHVESLCGVTFRVQGVRDCTLNHEIWKSLEVSWELVTMG